MSKCDLNFYYDQAYKAKTEIRPHYQKTLEYTDIFQTITDTNSPNLEVRRDIDSDILQAISGLKSYMMEAVFNRTDKWASVQLNEDLYRLSLGNDAEDLNIENTIKEINRLLIEDTDKSFTYIQSSNYYNEIGKAIQDLIVLGTGCYKIINTNKVSEPFIFQYQSLDNLYIWEDEMSRPNIVFKHHFGVTATYLEQHFGTNLNLESLFNDEDSPADSIDVIESVIPKYDINKDKTTFTHKVTARGFNHVIYENDLPCNPFIVFRWETIKKSPWGMGLGLSLVDTFKELKGYRQLRQLQSERIANPPMNFTGNKEILYHLSKEAGAINWLGENEFGNSDFRPSNSTRVDLMPLDSDIKDLRERIHNTFMTMPLGDVTDTKYTTALAVQIRHQEFRKRFSATYELLNTELLTPTFLGPFSILVKKGLLNTGIDTIEYADIKYVNELTKAADKQEVEKILMYAQTANQMIQLNQSGILYKNAEVLTEAENKLGMKPSLLYTTEEKQAIEEQRQQALQQQAMQEQQQQGGMNGQAVPNPTEQVQPQ